MILTDTNKQRDYRDLVIEDQAAELHETKADLETLRVILSESMTMVAALTKTCARLREQNAALRGYIKPVLRAAA